MQFNMKGFVKHLTVVGVVALGFSSQVAFADDEELSKVYHVYVDDEHAGIVENKDVVEDYIAEKISGHQDENDFTYTVNEEIDYVTETVFSPQADSHEVLDYLDEELTVAVEAQALTIGADVVGYFAEEEQAEQVIQEYKEKYVSADVLKKIDNDSEPESEPLSVGESHIIDVSLTEEVSIEDKKVSEDEILSVKEGVTLLEKGTLENKKHVVDAGDVLGSIASKYDLSLDKLLELNEDLTEDSVIKIGDELNVTAYEPYVEVVVTEEKLEEDEVAYQTEVEESEDMYKGEEEVEQEGEKGTVETHYRMEKVNGKTEDMEVLEENVTKEPTNKVIVKGTKVVSSRGSGEFDWPAVGGSITSRVGERWGSYHKGIDIAGVSDRSILAADNGTVTSAGWDDGGYGNKIVIDHNNGYRTIYAHLSSIDVSSGQTVEKGQQIGVMGSTGFSTGTHLHFEVYKDGSLENPTDHL
ncbi:Murein DD-endopeptidase MepM and murein hydrolase activator NlpD, contain LysM domain [Gracilibacillus orientalis]|uniref:Murein DD-endopeptidase MepM and murein hydrolase activator NlpD, contain LysM domain n=1 Tax=Gracilibacillus orientalis TaxID=334253 RepID=A0A1I4K6N7_9BACI|nr:peptidoglycan DD-metalloendopeptidase family protein [Gracilibacillus orientalis]SFL74251.1 Murein DD-endopeptidase MepM and murein hydrolase activator NlpD, contain LysM domain [Gracilibacillus orientalis]